MSPCRKNNRRKKTRVPARTRNSRVVVTRSVRKDLPDYDKLARAVVALTKDMQEAKELGISVEELRDQKGGSKQDH